MSLNTSNITRARNIFIHNFLKGDLIDQFGGKGLLTLPRGGIKVATFVRVRQYFVHVIQNYCIDPDINKS